jgi:ABC-type branched-subunit amino acid transport system substrate-binding protein
VIYGDSYPPGVNDLSAQLRAAANTGADLILEVGHPAESVRTVQQAQQLNIQPKLLGFSDGPGAARFITDLHKAANFTVGATQWAPAARNPINYFLDSFHYTLGFAKPWPPRTSTRSSVQSSSTTAGRTRSSRFTSSRFSRALRS